MGQPNNTNADSQYQKFAAFLDAVLTAQEKAPGMSGKPLAINFRDMDHRDAAICAALGSQPVIAVLLKHGIKTFIPEGRETLNGAMNAFRKSKNENDVKNAIEATIHATEPEKAAAYRNAATHLLVKPEEAGIHVVFKDTRYRELTPAELTFARIMEGVPKSLDCTPEAATAALSWLAAQGNTIDLNSLMKKITDTAALRKNALDTLTAAIVEGKPASFYTLQGTKHSELYNSNPTIFAQKGYNVVDIALAPAEESHINAPVAQNSVLPEHLYSFRINEGFSGQAAQKKYIDVIGPDPLKPKQQTPADIAKCIADLPPYLQDALRNTPLSVFVPPSDAKATPSSPPSLKRSSPPR